MGENEPIGIFNAFQPIAFHSAVASGQARQPQVVFSLGLRGLRRRNGHVRAGDRMDGVSRLTIDIDGGNRRDINSRTHPSVYSVPPMEIAGASVDELGSSSP